MTDLPYARRVRGVLLGGAVGDALGAMVDDLSLPEIRARYGTAGKRTISIRDDQRAPISSITQRTLFTTEGLIRAWVRGESRGVGHPPSEVAAAYRRWLRTQGLPKREVTGDRTLWQADDGWLVREAWLHDRRTRDPLAAAGGALRRECGGPLGHPEYLGPPTPDPGALTHIAPVGLLVHTGTGHSGYGDESELRPAIYRLATEIAALTHPHPDAQQPAALLATTLWGLVHAHEPLNQAIANASHTAKLFALSGGLPQGGLARISRLASGIADPSPEIRACTPTQQAPTTTETLFTTTTLRLAGGVIWTPDLVTSLSRNRTAPEVLTTALHLALSHPAPEQFATALQLAVNHSGASSAVATVTAQLLGAMHGETALPKTWLFHLEKAETIARLAEDFARQMSGAAPVALDTWGPFTPDWLDRYPPC